MKVRKLLEIQSVLEDVPSDMLEDDFEYWSRSKSDWVNILDMDLVHVVRALNVESKLFGTQLKINNIKPNIVKRLKECVAELEAQDGIKRN